MDKSKKSLSKVKPYPEELRMALHRLNSAVIRELPEVESIREEVRELRTKYRRFD